MRHPIRSSSHRPAGTLVLMALLMALSVPASALAGVPTEDLQPDVQESALNPHFVNATNDATKGADDSIDTTSSADDQSSNLAALIARAVFQVRTTLADAALVHADAPLDDQVLSHQRGGAVGMMTVAAPQTMLKNNVTLWDEIVPPSPMPQPSDAARAAQGNNVVYTRK